MRATAVERVLTLRYAGLRWRGPLRPGAPGNPIRHRAMRAPARHMSDESTLGITTDPVFAAPELGRLEGLVRERVSEERFEHIERVARVADAIAAANGFSDRERGQVVEAALLHDAARDLSDAELIDLAPPRIDLERGHPLALHGRAGRALAASWGVSDEVVLSAVEGHVFGVPWGHRVGMAVYVADVCEPGRGVNEDIHRLALHDLSAAYRRAVISKVEYLERSGKEIHPDTLATYRAIVEGGLA